MILEYKSKFGIKKKITLEEGENYAFSSNKEDIYVSAFNDSAKLIIYQEGNSWVMMALNCNIQHGGKNLQSLDIVPGVAVIVDGLQIKFLEKKIKKAITPQEVTPLEKKGSSSVSESNIKKPDTEKQKKSLKQTYQENSIVFLSIFFAVALLFVFSIYFNKSNENKETTVVQKEFQKPANTQTQNQKGVQKDTVSKAHIQSKEITSDNDETLNKTARYSLGNSDKSVNKYDSAQLYYRSALGFYELGLLKKAVEEVQAGLLIYPGNKLLLSKLSEWEEHVDILVSQTFRDACRHALYLRNLEALQAFSLVIEMSINQQDLRYKESLRMHKALKNSSVAKRIECGA